MHKQYLVQCLKPVSRAESVRALKSVSFQLWESIDSPKSLACKLLYENREFAQLVALEVDPLHYTSARRYADDALAVKFLAKFPDFKHPDLKPEIVARDSFSEFEEMCRLSNKRFRGLEEDPSLWDPFMKDVFDLSKRKISSVLGAVNLDQISHGFGWGPGATTSAVGSNTSAYEKFRARLDVTSNSLIMGHCCINSTPSWSNCQIQTDEFPSVKVSLSRDAFNVVRGNEIVFVPKNAKTHRIIAKEPHVNSYLQKGFGSYIRRRLASVAGIDLNDQSLNQRLAMKSSITGHLATIDLSGASDTISRELVRLLLPAKWFSLLDACRSKQGFLRKEDTWVCYEKFSSMGNAFTFELESLIFWALCDSVKTLEQSSGELNVYGDDIIVPVEIYPSVVKVIDFAGFRVNASKSFSSGVFRESCGKDYFDGTDVRPIFLKESLSNVENLLKLANSLRRYSHRRSFNCGCDKRFRDVWLLVISLIPGPFRSLKIPEGFGDGGIASNFDEACPSLSKRRKADGWEGFEFKMIIRQARKLAMKDEHAGYTASLQVAGQNKLRTSSPTPLQERIEGLFGESSPLGGYHALRSKTLPKVAQIHTHGWYDFGPWQ